MTHIFYLLAYAAILGFICIFLTRIRHYLQASPLHVCWALYPVPHEGPTKASYGGSYLEEKNWWLHPRHADHWNEIKSIFLEILFLHTTYRHNPSLWLRTYPFHLGIYMLMAGALLLIIAALLLILGLNPHDWFLTLAGNLVNALSFAGGLCMLLGGVGLIRLRATKQDLKSYTSGEQYLLLGAFTLFAFLTICAWILNPNYYELCLTFVLNLLTGTFSPIPSTVFVLSMLLAFFLLICIPLTSMGHVVMKYFLYHRMRWDDEPCLYSEKNQKKILEVLRFPVSWQASHIAGDGNPKTWLDVVTASRKKMEQDGRRDA